MWSQSASLLLPFNTNLISIQIAASQQYYVTAIPKTAAVTHFMPPYKVVANHFEKCKPVHEL